MIVTRSKSRCTLFLLELMTFVFSILECCFHELSIGIGILFFLYQLLAIFIPGAALYLLLCHRKYDAIICTGLFYSLGVLVVLAEYLVLHVLDLSKYSVVLSLIVSIVSILILINRIKYIAFVDSFIPEWLYLSICVCLLVLTTLTVSFANTLPNENGGNSFYSDWLFWLGNNISFSKGFPAQSLRLSGVEIQYHYFSSVLLAQMHLVTGIDISILTFYFSSILPMLMLPAASYMFFSSVLSKRKSIICGIIATLFTSGTSATYEWHLYYCPFGFDYGYIFALIAMSLLISFYEDGLYSIKEAVGLGILISITAGFKGPTALVLLPSFAVMAIYLIHTGRRTKGMCFGAMWILAFIAVYVLVIGGIERTQSFVGSTSTGEGFRLVSIGEQADSNVFVQSIGQKLVALHLPYNVMTKTLAVLLYVIKSNEFAIMCLLVGAIAFLYNLSKQGRVEIIDALLLAAGCVGTVLFVFTSQSGYSQMYFVLSIIAFADAAGLRVLERMSSEAHHKLFRHLVVTVVAFTLCVSVLAFFDKRSGYQSAADRIANGLRRHAGDVENGDYYLDEDCYAACIWLKENTPSDSIVAIDYFEDENGFSQNQVIGCFSERYVWNDGKYSDELMSDERKNLMSCLVNGDASALMNMRQDGVGYILQHRTINDSEYVGNDEAQIVYESEQYRIYELLLLANPAQPEPDTVIGV